jgi:hypothetical protein
LYLRFDYPIVDVVQEVADTTRIEHLTTIVVREDDLTGLIVDDFDRREVKTAGGGYYGDVIFLYVE